MSEVDVTGIAMTLHMPGQTWHFSDCVYDPEMELQVCPRSGEPAPLTANPTTLSFITTPDLFAVKTQALFKRALRVTEPDGLVTITKAEWDEYQVLKAERTEGP